VCKSGSRSQPSFLTSTSQTPHNHFHIHTTSTFRTSHPQTSAAPDTCLVIKPPKASVRRLSLTIELFYHVGVLLSLDWFVSSSNIHISTPQASNLSSIYLTFTSPSSHLSFLLLTPSLPHPYKSHFNSAPRSRR
jgi:hypothetical protein